MTVPNDDVRRPFATVTHARIRAAQGDLSGARRVLDEILGADSFAEGARELLDSLGRSPGQPRCEEPAEEQPAAPSVSDPRELALQFRVGLGAGGESRSARVARLTAWLVRIQAGGERVR